VAEGTDLWLSSLGYEREGNFYRVKKKNDQTVLMASHAGSSSALFSHIFNLPFPFICQAMEPTYTAVTIVSFGGEEGELIAPRFEIMNDARHIAGITAPNAIDN
jgi:probable phosphoglycerate mutase